MCMCLNNHGWMVPHVGVKTHSVNSIVPSPTTKRGELITILAQHSCTYSLKLSLCYQATGNTGSFYFLPNNELYLRSFQVVTHYQPSFLPPSDNPYVVTTDRDIFTTLTDTLSVRAITRYADPEAGRNQNPPLVLVTATAIPFSEIEISTELTILSASESTSDPYETYVHIY